MGGWVVGAAMNLVGSIAINLGTNVMKLGHNKRDAMPGKEDKPPILKFKEWQAGLVVFIVGNLLNFASFGFAAQSLLAALGSIQFVSNVVFAAFVLKEKITRMVLIATSCIILGCLMLVIFGNHSSEEYTAHDLLALYGGPVYIVYLVLGGAVVVSMYMAYIRGKSVIESGTASAKSTQTWTQFLPVAYSMFSALIGTQSVLFSKSLSVLLRATFALGDNQFTNWYTYVTLVCFLVTAGFWMTRLNKGLSMFPAMVIVPTLQICWTLFSLICGMCYFKEYLGFTPLKACMFTLGVLIVFLGVFLLTRDAGGQQAPEGKEQGEGKDHIATDSDSSRLLPPGQHYSNDQKEAGYDSRRVSGDHRFLDAMGRVRERVTSDFLIDLDLAKNVIGLGPSPFVATSPFSMPTFSYAHSAATSGAGMDSVAADRAGLLEGHESSSTMYPPSAPPQDVEVARKYPFGLESIKESPSGCSSLDQRVGSSSGDGLPTGRESTVVGSTSSRYSSAA